MALSNNSLLNENEIDDAKQSNLVVRIDQDSDNNLQALFDSVLKPGKTPLQVPFRMRKLPNSFFNPPSTGSKSPSASHSRANSTDSAFSIGSQTNISTAGGNTPTNPPPISIRKGVLISHSRAHSSPASLQQSYAELNTQKVSNTANNAINIREQDQPITNSAVQSVHSKQRSYDVSSIRLHNDLGDLPTGWEQARTSEGQIYYLNHITKTTQWEDPRVHTQQQAQSLLQPPPQATKETTTVANSDSLGPLPEGWEQAVTNSGDIYFINHVNRTTSWNDPRIPEYLQRVGPTPSPRPDMLNASNTSNWVNIRNLEEKEREYLKQRQAEIQHQDFLTRQNQQTMGLQMDPFLSDIDHSRQESGDSGLSLSSNNFLSNSEFLTHIDDTSMDCISENGNLDALGGLDNADNLVSSLQLNENLCNAMFNDGDNLMNPNSSKNDNLDWYNGNTDKYFR